MLKWGILGTSFISETMARAILDDEGSCLYAVAGRRQNAVDAFTHKFPVKKHFTDYHQLILDPAVDIIYIGLPNQLHHEYIHAAVCANKHVLCEKSLSVDMQKSRQIIDVTSGYGKLVIEGLMYLHHPVIGRFLDLLESNAIGKVRTLSGQYCADIASMVNQAGKGAIYNLGCYPVSLAHLILQQEYGNGIWANAKLTASGNRSSIDNNIFESQLNVQLSNGVSARIHTAETYGMHSHFDVIGDTGSVQFNTNPWLPAESNLMTLTSFNGEETQIRVEAKGDAFDYQVLQIRRAITLGKTVLARPAPSLQDSFEIMKLLTQWELLCLE